ncbi:hypothetical protein AUEXF2481DRAFT_151812 [Aureobasidium subglaciale EXF-2481]|uniref:Uncharacterized protein n=1 Tax=Aureobasidium subglaciale (strain EXF-2481) TaxID=1043005 RepID=A0A074Z332_AURSE|nr:uncharacterized protein AUEXF2481DRAFT_151812 [Aureobasidium subglaciale EXF-2481]KER00678.1 hypothetical protein AUEXF2481DRAFT_151812 [Aureobasidium subglaciale EXF-2481]
MYPPNTAAIRRQVCQQTPSATPNPPCLSCVFIQGTECNPYRGGQCDVFALEDDTGRKVAMRVFHDGGESSSYLLSYELKYRQEIEQLQIEHFAKVVSFSETGNELIGSPFVCLGWRESH